MSARTIKKSVLLRTSSRNNVQNGGGNLLITGLQDVPKQNIESITQSFYKAEVAQVVYVGNTSYTPTAGTAYQVVVYDPMRVDAGYTETPKPYVYVTPAVLTTIGANPADQREAIHAALVTAINLDATNHAVAASLGSGNGFSVTDDGGYYPVRAQNMTNVKGANTVLPITNDDDGTGFASNNWSLQTAAVYSSGVGARLLAGVPVVDFTFGNLISGSLDPLNAPVTTAGLPAVSGQNYDIFTISDLKVVGGTTLTEQYVFQIRTQVAVVDNGTGSSTANLTGFKAFEREMHKEIAQTFQKDKNSITEFFDKGYVMQANPGITPYTGTIAGTADVMKFFTTPYATKLEQYNINAQTIFAPLEVDAGLRIEQDVNATDGAHYCAGTLAYAPNSFIVGQQPFMCWARVVAGDWTDAFFMVGFRKKAVYAADYTTYDDLGAIGTQVSAVGDFVATQGNINNGTMKETVSSTVIAADGVSVLLMVKVALDGTVTAYRDGVSFPIYSVGTTQLVFDAGDEMIPFFQFINVNSSPSTLTFSELVSVASTDVLS